MRRTYFGLAAIAALALGLFCCWRSTKQAPKQPRDLSAVSVQPTQSNSEDALPSPPDMANNAGTPASAKSAATTKEERLVRRLHVLEATNPRLASSLALEDRARYPNSPDAEERDMILVTALNNQRDLLGAKREAWYYFMHYPNGKFTDFLSQLTHIQPPTTRPEH